MDSMELKVHSKEVMVNKVDMVGPVGSPMVKEQEEWALVTSRGRLRVMQEVLVTEVVVLRIFTHMVDRFIVKRLKRKLLLMFSNVLS